jgi:hypothetical protein
MATNVIHATLHLSKTLGTVHSLLRALGKLIFNELSASSVIEDVTFGLTDGWWYFSDFEIRCTYPLLKSGEWSVLFVGLGFKNAQCTPHVGVFKHQSIVVAEKQIPPQLLYPLSSTSDAALYGSYFLTGGLGNSDSLTVLTSVEHDAHTMEVVS